MGLYFYGRPLFLALAKITTICTGLGNFNVANIFRNFVCAENWIASRLGTLYLCWYLGIITFCEPKMCVKERQKPYPMPFSYACLYEHPDFRDYRSKDYKIQWKYVLWLHAARKFLRIWPRPRTLQKKKKKTYCMLEYLAVCVWSMSQSSTLLVIYVWPVLRIIFEQGSFV